MSNFAIWMTVLAVLSIVTNIFMFWYVRSLLSRFIFLSSNLDDLIKMVQTYSNHLTKVYNMEMFYGDATLEYLMQHTKSLREMLQEYENVSSIMDEPLEAEEEQEEKQIEEKIKVEEENVFYAGTRTGNR